MNRIVEVSIDDDTHQVVVVLDPASYAALERKAKKARISVADYAKRIIMDGMKKEMRRG